MKIQYELTKKELLDLNLNYVNHLPTWRIIKRVHFGFSFLFIAFCFWVCARSSDFIATAIAIAPLWRGAIGILVILLAFYRFYLPFSINRKLSNLKGKSLFVPRELEITSEGISDSEDTPPVITAWKDVTRIVVVPDGAIVFVKKGGHLIPKRVFASDAEFEALVGEIQGYHKQVTGR